MGSSTAPDAVSMTARFGLFTADDDRMLDKALASMPLHVWRTDEVTPLSHHPNDRASLRSQEAVEFLTPPNQPGQWRTLGLWSARDADDLQATLESLPL